MIFLGNIDAKTDAKGRVFLPAVFRKVLQASGEEELVLRKEIHKECLVLYPRKVWDRKLDELRSRLNLWRERDKMVLRTFVASAEQVALDGNGRFLLSRRSMELVGIRQSVTFIGVDDTIEIWATENIADASMSPEDFSGAVEELMGKDFNF